MDLSLFCTLCFLFLNSFGVRASSAEEKQNEKNKIYVLPEEGGGEETAFYSDILSGRSLESCVDRSSSSTFYNEPIPSTSRDVQHSVPWFELLNNPSLTETAEELETSQAESLLLQSVPSLHYTNNPLLTEVSIGEDTSPTDLSENIPFNKYGQNEQANIENVHDVFPHGDFSKMSEYIVQKSSDDRRLCSQNLYSCTNTSYDTARVIQNVSNNVPGKVARPLQDLQSFIKNIDDVFAGMKENLKKIYSTAAPSPPSYVKYLNTESADTFESPSTNTDKGDNNSNTNNSTDLLGYVLKNKKAILCIRRYQLNHNIQLLKHIHNVMINCTSIDIGPCTKGFSIVLELAMYLKSMFPVNSKILDNAFLKYSHIVNKDLACGGASKEINSVSDFLNSFSVYMLGLMLTYLAPSWYNIVKQKNNQKKILSKKIIQIDICRRILESKTVKTCMAECNKLKWFRTTTTEIPIFLIFSYVLLLSQEDEISNALEQYILKNYNVILFFRYKCAHIVELWLDKNVNNHDELQLILNDVQNVIKEVNDYHQLLEPLIYNINKNITSKLQTVENLILFLTFWLGIIYLECLGAKDRRTKYNSFISFHVFQNFFRECQSYMSLENMLKYSELCFLTENQDVLSDFFMCIHLRFFKQAALTIVNFLNDLNSDLERIKNKSNGDLNKKKVFLLKTKHSDLTYKMEHHITILKKIIQHRKKMQYIQSINLLILKIHKEVKVLEKYALRYKRNHIDKFKIIVEKQCAKIEAYYKTLRDLLNENIQSDDKESSDDE